MKWQSMSATAAKQRGVYFVVTKSECRVPMLHDAPEVRLCVSEVIGTDKIAVSEKLHNPKDYEIKWVGSYMDIQTISRMLDEINNDRTVPRNIRTAVSQARD